MPWVSEKDVYKHIIETRKNDKCRNLTPIILEKMLRSYNRRIKTKDAEDSDEEVFGLYRDDFIEYEYEIHESWAVSNATMSNQNATCNEPCAPKNRYFIDGKEVDSFTSIMTEKMQRTKPQDIDDSDDPDVSFGL